MAFEPDFETIAGTQLFIAAGKPTDDTEAAFETLFTAASGGDEFELTSVGGVEGRSSDIATLSVVSRGRNRQKPGTYTFPQSDFGIQWLPESDAHETATTALRDRSYCSFKLVRQSGVTLFFIGYVLNLSEAGGASNDALTGTLSILRDSETITAVTP
jgi:hypothetical protein